MRFGLKQNCLLLLGVDILNIQARYEAQAQLQGRPQSLYNHLRFVFDDIADMYILDVIAGGKRKNHKSEKASEDKANTTTYRKSQIVSKYSSGPCALSTTSSISYIMIAMPATVLGFSKSMRCKNGPNT